MRYRPLEGNHPHPEPEKRQIREYQGKLAKRHAITRNCQHCGNPLSRYNPMTTCWHHDYEERAAV